MRLIVNVLLIFFVLIGTVFGSAQLDAKRYIGIDELKSGMTGYGLTVFKGTRIEKFDVVLVSVMRNFEAKRDAILVKCIDERFDTANGVQGVSGSPVYFDGRMAGAMSFSWQFSEEPLYGVTPISEMLDVKQTGMVGKKKRASKAKSRSALARSLYSNLMRDVLLGPDDIARLVQKSGLGSVDSTKADGLARLPMVVSISGANSQALSLLRRYLPGINVQSTISAAGDGESVNGQAIKLQPGASLVVPLAKGDMNAAVVGTVTEVVGDSVYGFGHSWNGDGVAWWPMGTGYIHTFVNSKSMSFKLGNLLEIVGAIHADEAAAVYGEIGQSPPMAGITATVNWANIKEEKQLHVQIVRDELIDPLLAASVMLSAILQRGGIPRENAIEYELTMDFDGSEGISYSNITSGNDMADIILEVVGVVGLFLNNPWQEVALRKMSMKATIIDQDKVGVVKSAQLARRVYRPGQQVEVQVVLEPYRHQEQKITVKLLLPDDIPAGRYKVSLGSDLTYLKQLRTAQPHSSTAFCLDDIHRILQKRLALKRDRLYISMVLPEKGLTIEGKAMPAMPAGRAMLLMDKSRLTAMKPFKGLATASVKTDLVVAGGKIFEIEVRRD